MAHFIGSYELKVGEKGRIAIPKSMFEHLKEVEGTSKEYRVAVCRPENHLVCYPLSFYNHFRNTLDFEALPDNAPERSFDVRGIDGYGRMLLPADFRKTLDNVVKVVGVGMSFELWNPDEFSSAARRSRGSIREVMSRLRI